jgi:cytochrome P450
MTNPASPPETPKPTTPPLNLLDPEFRANPYPTYARLRRELPVCRVEPGGMWAAFRYDDVVNGYKNSEKFSSGAVRVAGEPPWLGRHNPMSSSLLGLDPPQHGRLRALVNRAFGPHTLARMEPRIRAWADDLIGKMVERRQVDFVSEFSLPLPSAVIGELLGLDPSLQSSFKRWSDHLVFIPAVPPDHVELQNVVRGSINEMEGYLQQVLDSRRREPGDDLISDLLRARVDGDSLTERELMGFCFLLLLGGLETTVYMLGNIAVLLAERPDVWARLKADRSLIPRFVEELLRTEPPLHGTVRLTTTEVELSGVRLPPGTLLLLMQGSALRDEAYFPEGERFELDRTANANLAFGQGGHFCLGSGLARLEARLAVEVLLDRCEKLVRPEGPVQYCQSLTLRGPSTLPLELIPA